jgi:hypothetical protein
MLGSIADVPGISSGWLSSVSRWVSMVTRADAATSGWV